jgi:hypothetical protein
MKGQVKRFTPVLGFESSVVLQILITVDKFVLPGAPSRWETQNLQAVF